MIATLTLINDATPKMASIGNAVTRMETRSTIERAEAVSLFNVERSAVTTPSVDAELRHKSDMLYAIVGCDDTDGPWSSDNPSYLLDYSHLDGFSKI